jgi:hypothetical protein
VLAAGGWGSPSRGSASRERHPLPEEDAISDILCEMLIGAAVGQGMDLQEEGQAANGQGRIAAS